MNSTAWTNWFTVPSLEYLCNEWIVLLEPIDLLYHIWTIYTTDLQCECIVECMEIYVTDLQHWLEKWASSLYSDNPCNALLLKEMVLWHYVCMDNLYHRITAALQGWFYAVIYILPMYIDNTSWRNGIVEMSSKDFPQTHMWQKLMTKGMNLPWFESSSVISQLVDGDEYLMSYGNPESFVGTLQLQMI